MTSILELKPKPSNWEPEKIDLKGHTPESWNCIGVNTAPGELMIFYHTLMKMMMVKSSTISPSRWP